MFLSALPKRAQTQNGQTPGKRPGVFYWSGLPLRETVMRIGIVSDTHNNLKNVRKIVELFNDHAVDRVIHTGDISQAKTLHVFADLNAHHSSVFLAITIKSGKPRKKLSTARFHLPRSASALSRRRKNHHRSPRPVGVRRPSGGSGPCTAWAYPPLSTRTTWRSDDF